jgi:transcriptional regulator with XRE-family HTH domain
MTNRKAATAAALAGAVALASAAYGIGTQTDDGTASAARDNGSTARDGAPGERIVHFGFGDLAERLGVDENELSDALRDFHEREHTERRDAFAEALAQALDKPVDEVRAALDEVRPQEGDRPRPGCAPHVSLRGLAAELDVTRAELREALREVRSDVDSALDDLHDDLVAFLADRFGLSEQEVEDALPEPPDPPRFERGGPPPLGHGGPPRLRFGMPG